MRIDQVEYLREHGISTAQGYVFAPPLPGSAFATLTDAINPVAAENEKFAAAAGKARRNAGLGRF
jgi:EAL domain-containing protein (putative c-di-GMP-specific phosphodiesterase class I)